MKKQIPLILFGLVLIVSIFAFVKPDGEIQLQGVVRNEAGYLVDKIEILIHKNGEYICEGKSDKYGNYSLTLFEEGTYNITVGRNNNNYYTVSDTSIQILPLKIFRRDFLLKVNKQELQHRATRLTEAYQHLEKNPMNIYYKGTYFNRFPSSMDEMLLFFSPKIPYFNLKKESDDIVTKFVDTQMVSDTSYFVKYSNILLGWTEQTDIKCYKYFTARMDGMIFKNPKGFFDVLNFYNNDDVKSILLQTLKGFNRDQLNTTFEKLSAYNPRIYKIYKETASEMNIK
ncbi:MAG: hypothetical protein NT150_10890 [Bacteroidetes bacterium]|nr:hypothetical protein [Bacteroidota bacterium]